MSRRTHRIRQRGRLRVAMLLENQPYPRDVRVRAEAEALGRAGHAVTVLAPRGPGEPRRETVNGVAVRRFAHREGAGGRLSFILEYAIAHAQLVRLAAVELARGADVLHVHNPPDTLALAGLLARVARRRVVFDQHDLFPELVGTRFGMRLARVALAAQRAALRIADVVIVTNQSQRELAIRRGAAPADVVVVRNGPASSTLAARPATRRGPLAVPRLVYVGELGPQDGVLELPDLLGDPALANARLTVIGDGECGPELARRLAVSPELAARVELMGRVEHARVPELLARADIGLDPAPCTALNQRSTMIKIGEYLAAGLPVAAHDLVETRRTAGDAGLYARCGEPRALAAAVSRLATDDDLRAGMADAALVRARELVWERSEPALLDVYAGLGVSGA
jgi:glycosyltransferase involved in cell wall biosynthesis